MKKLCVFHLTFGRWQSFVEFAVDVEFVAIVGRLMWLFEQLVSHR